MPDEFLVLKSGARVGPHDPVPAPTRGNLIELADGSSVTPAVFRVRQQELRGAAQPTAAPTAVATAERPPGGGVDPLDSRLDKAAEGAGVKGGGGGGKDSVEQLETDLWNAYLHGEIDFDTYREADKQLKAILKSVADTPAADRVVAELRRGGLAELQAVARLEVEERRQEQLERTFKTSLQRVLLDPLARLSQTGSAYSDATYIVFRMALDEEHALDALREEFGDWFEVQREALRAKYEAENARLGLEGDFSISYGIAEARLLEMAAAQWIEANLGPALDRATKYSDGTGGAFEQSRMEMEDLFPAMEAETQRVLRESFIRAAVAQQRAEAPGKVRDLIERSFLRPLNTMKDRGLAPEDRDDVQLLINAVTRAQGDLIDGYLNEELPKALLGQPVMSIEQYLDTHLPQVVRDASYGMDIAKSLDFAGGTAGVVQGTVNHIGAAQQARVVQRVKGQTAQALLGEDIDVAGMDEAGLDTLITLGRIRQGLPVQTGRVVPGQTLDQFGNPVLVPETVTPTPQRVIEQQAQQAQGTGLDLLRSLGANIGGTTPTFRPDDPDLAAFTSGTGGTDAFLRLLQKTPNYQGLAKNPQIAAFLDARIKNIQGNAANQAIPELMMRELAGAVEQASGTHGGFGTAEEYLGRVLASSASMTPEGFINAINRGAFNQGEFQTMMRNAAFTPEEITAAAAAGYNLTPEQKQRIAQANVGNPLFATNVGDPYMFGESQEQAFRQQFKAQRQKEFEEASKGLTPEQGAMVKNPFSQEGEDAAVEAERQRIGAAYGQAQAAANARNFAQNVEPEALRSLQGAFDEDERERHWQTLIAGNQQKYQPLYQQYRQRVPKPGQQRAAARPPRKI